MFVPYNDNTLMILMGKFWLILYMVIFIVRYRIHSNFRMTKFTKILGWQVL